MMRLSTTALTVTALGAIGTAQAQQVNFNEIFASHTGSDTEEYIELIGTPGMALDGYMVVIIDSDGFAGGILDRAWDLAGYSIPSDGYFVMANPGNAALDYNMDLGPHSGFGQDNIENGSQTYYLLTTTDVLFIESLHNSDTDPDGDGFTVLSQFPGTIDLIEVIGVYDDDYQNADEILFDGALELGPDLAGPWSPAGYFRPDDYPSGWCTDEWLDFFLSGLTPGAMNPSSGCTLSGGGGGVNLGTNYCGPANLNSAGIDAKISAFGSATATENYLELTAFDLPTNQFAYFINSQTQGFTANPGGSQGNLCVSGAIGRHTSQLGSSGSTGSFMISVDLTDVPTPSGPTTVLAGQTWNWQCWYRDKNPNNTSNFTDGIEITFN